MFTDVQPVNTDLDQEMASTMAAHATVGCPLFLAHMHDSNDGKCFCGLFLKFLYIFMLA